MLRSVSWAESKVFTCTAFAKANQLLGSYKPIKVESFSELEIHNYIDYYIEKNWLQTPHARTDDGREEIKFLSGCNPAQFRRICQPLWTKTWTLAQRTRTLIHQVSELNVY